METDTGNFTQPPPFASNEDSFDAGASTNLLSQSFRNRSTAMSADDLRKARESRAADALKMKDEQLRILTEQNSNLLKSLDKLEEEANGIQLEKLAVDQENRSVRDTNFELQSKTRAAETQAKRMTSEVTDKEKQLRIMTDQNSELLRLLESEESLTTQLQSEVSQLRTELNELRQKHSALLSTAKTHEELATKAAKEGQLRAEEIRLLRVEVEQLKQQNTELKMKTQVEVEALQEQLRVRKEKQYQLLEKLQAQEEAKRQAEDQVAGMEEQLRGLHARNVDLETQIKVEARGKSNVEEANKELQLENGNLFNANKELQTKIEKSEKERLRMEAEARDSGDQLREMAEKVFQLLERLKLAELGKTKAMDALKKKEQDMVSLQKKNARLIKESTEESKLRVKAELDCKVLQDQVRAVKKNNDTLSKKSKEEALLKVKALEEVEQLQEKVKTTESRLSFLLNKVQADEETRIIQAEDRKKLEAQVISYSEKCEELQHKLTEMGESNRVITQAMRLKQEELNQLNAKYDHLLKEMHLRDGDKVEVSNENMDGAKPGGPDDVDNVRLNEGRGRFYVEAKSIGGGSLLLLRSRKPLYREWLDKQHANDFLRKIQKTTRFRDLIVEKFGALYGLLMVEEEEKITMVEQMQQRDTQMDHLQKKLAYIQDTLAVEEDAKRRMLLRYIHAVKEHAMAVDDGSGGVLQLPESNITDEETHALAALLRNNMSIEELNLRGNSITDDGARALGAVLAGKSSLKLIDLRGNKIGKGAIRILAEALERADRVRHVYVHAGGKIEALGAGRWANPRDQTGGSMGSTAGSDQGKGVETICVVDIRDNNPEATSFPYELNKVEDNTGQPASSVGSFNPLQLLDNTGVPNRKALAQSQSEPAIGKKPKKEKGDNKMARSASSVVRDVDVAITKAEEKKAKMKAHTEKLMALKEAQWQGRAGTFDHNQDDRQSGESLRIKNKKSGSNSNSTSQLQLPPISSSGDFGNNTFDGEGGDGQRVQSAPDLNNNREWEGDHPEGIMARERSNNNGTEAAKDDLKKLKKKVKKKASRKDAALEKTLKAMEADSPFNEPVAPSGFDGK